MNILIYLYLTTGKTGKTPFQVEVSTGGGR